MLSTPASTARILVKLDIPVVAWVWRWIGIFNVFFKFEINSKAYSGLKIPDMSFIHNESHPRSSISLDKSTQLSSVWTGLIV